MSSGSIVDAVRQPEYTGENRCTPCTVVNTAIAIVLSVAVGGGLAVGTSLGLAVAGGAGAAVFLVSAAAIYVRGYLVPKTPELTKRYFPDRVLAWFDKAPEPGVAPQVPADPTPGTTTQPPGTATESSNGDGPGEPDEDLQPEAVLLSAGAVEECAEVDDLCLAADFESAWREGIQSRRGEDPDAEAILAALDMDDVEEAVVERYGDAVVLKSGGREIGKWESNAALLADLTAADLLADRVEDWETTNAFDRSRLLRGLRIFVEQCPECGGPISLGQDTVESCCRSFEVVAVTCEDCESRLFEEQMRNAA